MKLHGLMRKAAGLMFELPPEEAETASPEAETPAPGGPSATDALWAELEKASAKPALPVTPSLPINPTKTVEQIVRETQGPSLEQITVTGADLKSVSGPDGSVDFPSIYQAAGLPTVPFTSEQILDMLAGLPADLALQTKRQMMKVSLDSMGKAIGATPQNIVADASRKLAALSAYSEHQTKATNEYITLSEQKIALLQEQIEQARQAISSAREKLSRETSACTGEAHRLDEVLEFFSLDVAPSKYAAPTENKAPGT